MFITNIISTIITVILGIVALYFAVYAVIGLFTTRKFRPAEKLHKYAILIAARNEEAVIGNLLDSIDRQDYPKELLTVFVVADNCTDKTAEVVRNKGAVCYERFNNEKRTKGFALQFLFENIKKDYGIDSFEGYFIFDADNLLNSDYISRMNDAFDEGEKVITSYRNTKNFDENWIASTYAIHWLRFIRLNHRARSVLRLATNIQGTGFLFANELVRDGWHYTSLTEDRAFTVDAVIHGYAISYNDAAEFFDEQPISIRVALRQRIRWSKGHLMAFTENWFKLVKGIIFGKHNKEVSSTGNLNSVRLRWASFDTLTQLFPAALASLIIWLIFTVGISMYTAYQSGIGQQYLFAGEDILSKILNLFFGNGILIDAPAGIKAAVITLLLALFWKVAGQLAFYAVSMLQAIYVFISEKKRIIKIPLRKKILYTITWPLFDAVGKWTLYAALFMKVEWKPIPHSSTVTINQIENSKSDSKKQQ